MNPIPFILMAMVVVPMMVLAVMKWKYGRRPIGWQGYDLTGTLKTTYGDVVYRSDGTVAKKHEQS